MHQGNAERGFTLIELMIVVAIIAVLALVVVPQFMKQGTRAKAKSEVSPMFAELAHKEDQYKLENGSYLAAAACPSAASRSGTNAQTACLTTGSAWTKLRIVPSETMLSCSYTVSAGTSATSPISTIPSWVTSCKGCSTLTAPATSWYYIIGTCTDASYFTASWDAKIRASDGK